MKDEQLSADSVTYKPLLFLGKDANGDFEKFHLSWKVKHGALTIVDDTVQELEEFLFLENPALLKQKTIPANSLEFEYAWIVFPWRNMAVRTLSKEKYNALRTSRNYNLITHTEASTLSQKKIGIAGLNVGNPAAVCLAQEGIGEYMRLADNDTLSLSNLNRFRASIIDLGINKAVLSARQAMEINPFLSISVWENGVAKETIPEFVSGLDLLIEEMDVPPLKVAIREEARRQRIPTIMVTGNGHDIILDVERFDEDGELPILSGMLTNTVMKTINSGVASFDEKIALARDFMGREYLSDRLNSSFDEIGKTLIGIPQLAEASFLRGAVLAHTAREILLKNSVPSGRYMFGLSDLYEKRQ